MLTARYPVNFVWYEEVNQRHNGAKERARKVFPVLDRRRIGRAERKTPKRPRNRRNKVADHKDVMPLVVVRTGDICPATAGERPEYAPEGDELGQAMALSVCQEVPQPDERESGPGGHGDEDHEEGALGIAVADGGGDGGKPFLWPAEPLILDDLLVV
jgi:hypothetical protein